MRKAIFMIFGMLISLSALIGTAYADLVANWTFDEGFGQYANDTSDHGNDGILGNTTLGDDSEPRWITDPSQCVSGYCLEFDGYDDYVLVQNDSSLYPGIGGWTVSMWIYPREDLIDDRPVVGSGWCVPPYDFWTTWTSNNKFSFDVGDYDPYCHMYPDSEQNLSLNAWWHVVGVIEKVPQGNDVIRVYVNGKESGSQSTCNFTNLSSPDNIYFATSCELNEWFNGLIDEVAIWNESLSSEEVQSLYSSYLGCPEGTTVPQENLYINEDTVLCPRTWYLGDSDKNGAVIINASGVTLDCNGAVLSGSELSGSIGINIAGFDNVTVKNCVLQNYDIGIYLYYSSNSTITNNTASNNYYRGIFLYYSSNNIIISNNIVNHNGDGIYLNESSNIDIINNIIYNNTGPGGKWKDGIRADDNCSNIRIENNEIFNNVWGINLYAEGATTFNNFTIINNDVYSNKEDGIWIEYLINSTIANNTVSNNWHGIYFWNSSNNTITNNNASNNDEGIELEESSNNTITNNIASNNDEGIYLLYSSNNIIANNTVSNSTTYGIRLSYSSGNIIYNNLFNNTNNFRFLGTIYANYWNTTKQRGDRIYSPGTKIGGNYWTNPTGNGFSDTCTDANNDGFCDSNYTLATNNIDYLPLSDEGVVMTNPWISGGRYNITFIGELMKGEKIIIYGSGFSPNGTVEGVMPRIFPGKSMRLRFGNFNYTLIYYIFWEVR